MAKIANLIVDLSANVAEFRSSMNDAAESVSSLSETVLSAKDAIIDFLVARQVVSFIKDAAAATEEWAFSIQKLSQVTGISAQDAGAFTAIAREEGVSADTVSAALGRLSLAIANHPKKFTELGIAIRDISGNLLPMQTILGNTVKGLDAFEQGTNRSAAASRLLGRGAQSLLPDLERLGPALNNANFQRATDLIRGLGLEIDASGVAKAREWERAQADLGLAFLAVQNQIGQAILPAIKELGDAIADLARSGELKAWAEGAAKGIIGVTLAFAELTDFIASHNQIVGTILAISGGVAAIESPSVTGRAAGFAAFAAGWKMTGTGADEAAAKVHAATEKMVADLKRARDDIGKTQATAIGDNAAIGTKTFSGPAAGGRGASDAQRANEEFQKLSASLTEQIGFQNALTVAWEQGGKAVQGLIEHQKAYETSLRLGKGATDEMRAAIMQKSLAEQEAADRAKAAQKATEDQQRAVKTAGDEFTKISVQLRDHIRLETDLAAAYGQGAAAVQAVIDKDKIRAEVEKLGVAATREQIAGVQQLAAADIQASNLAEQSKLRADNLKTAAEGVGQAFETAFKSATTPGNDLLKTLNDLGKSLEDLILKALIFKPLEDALTASVSGGGGGFFGLFSSIFGGSTSAAVHHAGGMVGGPAPMRDISAAAFIGAPRMRNGGQIIGLGADEVPIIAHLGETITPAGKSPATTGHRPFVFSPTYIIQTPDPGAFGASHGQIVADGYRHMQQVANRNT